MCVQVLIDWINSELEEERIIVKDLEEDCYDGQVLQKLFGEKLVSLASLLSQYIYPYSFCRPSTCTSVKSAVLIVESIEFLHSVSTMFNGNVKFRS